MPYLTNKQLEDLLKNKPQGATDAGIITDLKRRGYQLQGGVDIPAIQEQPTQEKSPKQGLEYKIGKFLGMEKFGKGLGMALAQPEIERQQEELTKTDIQLQQNLQKRIREARMAGDTARAQRLVEAGQKGAGQPSVIEEFAAEAPTNKEVIGSAILTGLAVLSGGHLSGGPSGFMPQYTAKLPYELTLGGRLKYAAARGAIYGTASGLEKDKDVAGITGKAITGAAISTATALIFEGLHEIYNKLKVDPETQNIRAAGIRAKDLQKDNYFGNETIGDKMIEQNYHGNITDVKQQSIHNEDVFGRKINKLLTDNKDKFENNKITNHMFRADTRIDNLVNAPETTEQERIFLFKALDEIPDEIVDGQVADNFKIKWANRVNWDKAPDGYKRFVEDAYRKLSNIMREKIEERVPEIINVNSDWATAHTVHLSASRLESQLKAAKDIVDYRGWINTIFKKTLGSTQARLGAAKYASPVQEYIRNVAEQFSPSIQNAIVRIFTK